LLLSCLQRSGDQLHRLIELGRNELWRPMRPFRANRGAHP